MKHNTIIKQLIESSDITKTELAKKIHVSSKIIDEWETGKLEPDNASLIELSKIFNVSIDYLLLGQDNNAISNMSKAEEVAKKDDVELYKKYNSQLHNQWTNQIDDKGFKLWDWIVKYQSAKLFSYLFNDDDSQERTLRSHLVDYHSIAAHRETFRILGINIDRSDVPNCDEISWIKMCLLSDKLWAIKWFNKNKFHHQYHGSNDPYYSLYDFKVLNQAFDMSEDIIEIFSMGFLTDDIFEFIIKNQLPNGIYKKLTNIYEATNDLTYPVYWTKGYPSLIHFSYLNDKKKNLDLCNGLISALKQTTNAVNIDKKAANSQPTDSYFRTVLPMIELGEKIDFRGASWRISKCVDEFRICSVEERTIKLALEGGDWGCVELFNRINKMSGGYVASDREINSYKNVLDANKTSKEKDILKSILDLTTGFFDIKKLIDLQDFDLYEKMLKNYKFDEYEIKISDVLSNKDTRFLSLAAKNASKEELDDGLKYLIENDEDNHDALGILLESGAELHKDLRGEDWNGGFRNRDDVDKAGTLVLKNQIRILKGMKKKK